jgi:hypothetical protein
MLSEVRDIEFRAMKKGGAILLEFVRSRSLDHVYTTLKQIYIREHLRALPLCRLCGANAFRRRVCRKITGFPGQQAGAQLTKAAAHNRLSHDR